MANNCNTAVMVQHDGYCRVRNITAKDTSRAYANISAIPKWMQKDILWLKWSPKGVWSKLGMWRHVSMKDDFASDGDVMHNIFRVGLIVQDILFLLFISGLSDIMYSIASFPIL